MDYNFKIITKSAKETEKLGESLANKLILKQIQDDDGAKIICLYGNLGSGKTTFTKGFACRLGIKQRVISPTFIIIRQYELAGKYCSRPQAENFSLRSKNIIMFYHIDLYRIQSLNNVKALGIEEILADPENIVLIEWPEIIKEILPKKRIEIYFKYLKESERSIIICHFDRPRCHIGGVEKSSEERWR